MKRYIRCSIEESILTELNNLPVFPGYSRTTYADIQEYEAVLNRFPVGAVIGMDWDAGNCYFSKITDTDWAMLDSPWYKLETGSTYDVATKLASRGVYCDEPLWLDTQSTFEAKANRGRNSGSGGSGWNFWDRH